MKKQCFDNNEYISTTIFQTQKDKMNNQVGNTVTYKQSENITNLGIIPYGKFVTQIAQKTSIPIQIIHKILWNKLLEFSKQGLSKENYFISINA